MNPTLLPQLSYCALLTILVVFMLIVGVICEETGETFYEQPMFLDPNTISITSITYNPSSHTSEWIRRMFGEEAIFYNRTSELKSPKPLTAEEKKQRTKIFQDSFHMPSDMLLPSCSIEMLGYVVVNEESPLSFDEMAYRPSIGFADLVFYDLEEDAFNENQVIHTAQEKWRCVYRASYDNTAIITNLKLRPHHYWPVFLYCPAPNHEVSCLSIVDMYRNRYKRLLIDELKAKNQHLKKNFPNMKFPEKSSETWRKKTHNRGRKTTEKPIHPITEDLHEVKDNTVRRSLLPSVNNQGNDDVELYKRLVRNINSITNLNILGLRSFYAIPSYTISRKYIIESYSNIIGSDVNLQYPTEPTFNQPNDPHIFFQSTQSNDNQGDQSTKKKKSLPTIHLTAKLFFHLNQTTWELPIEIDLLNSVRKTRTEDLAVCSIIPYVSSDDRKAVINGAMIYEYIRYYSKLGYKIMLFDRNGRHYDSIFHSSYAQRFHSSSNTSKPFHYRQSFPNVHYYNYTLLQILKGYPIDIRYENDIGLSPAVVYTDYDKRYTYTHCRFALKHLYGIENIVINDFDEFLYCPKGTLDIHQQKKYQQDYFNHVRLKGFEQLFMKQRVLVSKELDMKECMFNQILSSSPANHNASIFHCLSRFKYSIKSFFDKTLHYGHYCPYTHYHYSSYLRFFDCYANSYLTATKMKRNYDVAGCSMIHITTRPATYNRSYTYRREDVMTGTNELFYIANS